MSDSGSTQFPAGPRPPGGDSTRSGSGSRVQLLGVPNEVRQIDRATRIQGEVERSDRGGRVDIRTERGRISVQYPPKETPPPRGERVEVTLPPANRSGQAADQARVRPLPSQQGARSADTRQADSLPPRGRDTPVDVRVQPQPEPQPELQPSTPPPDAGSTARTDTAGSQPASPPVPGLPPPGTTVRLEPVTPYQLATQIQPQSPLPQIINTSPLVPASPEAALSALPPLPLPAQGIETARPAAPAISITETIASNPFVLAPAFAEVPAASNTPELNALPQAAPSRTLLQIPVFDLQGSALSADTLPAFTISRTSPALAAAPPLPVLPEQGASLSFITAAAFPPPVFLTPETQTNTSPGGQPQTSLFQTPRSNPFLTPNPFLTQGEPAALFSQNIGSRAQPLIVIGQTENRLPVVRPAAIHTARAEFFSAPGFIVHAPSALAAPPGAMLVVEPLPGQTRDAPLQISTPSPPLGPIPPALAPPPGLFTGAGGWPLMDDIIQTLQQTAPQVAQATTNMMPSANNPAQLGPAVLFFIAAMRGGHPVSWLSDKAQSILQQSAKGQALLSRLTQDGSVIARTESPGADWRSAAIPYYAQDQAHKIIMHYKHERQDEGESADRPGGTTRFIFDLNLSHMGPVQIDGLYRTQRLDVILRSEQTFSTAMRQAMKQTYIGAVREAGLEGELSFQKGMDKWVTVKVQDHTEHQVSV